MNGRNDVFTAENIRNQMGTTNVVGRKMVCLDEIPSTNDYAKELARSGGENGTVVLAQSQTAGRGRMGRKFLSSAGKGIYLTVLLKPELPAEQLAQITALAGVAVCDAVERVCGVRPGLKWPNDPVLNGKKLCGILTELQPLENGSFCLLLGIGINVLQTAEDFTPEVAEIATSLRQALQRDLSRSILAAEVIRALDRMYARLLSGELETDRAAYRRDCVNLGKTVQILEKGRREIAQAVGVDDAFGLVVRYADGSQRVIRSGEVSVRGMYGYAE